MAWLFQARSDTKAIQLGNEEWGHTLAIGTNFTKIRIGMRISCPAIQSFDGNLPIAFVLGMTQGTAAMFKSPQCTEFLGLVLGNSTTPTWTYSASPGPNVTNPRPNFASKVGAVLTTHTGLSANYYVSANPAVRTMAFIDFTKNGGSSWTIAAWMPGNTTQGSTDNTFAQWAAAMENNTTPSSNVNSIFSTTVTHTGANLLDTVYFSWNKCFPPFNIYEIGAVRVW